MEEKGHKDRDYMYLTLGLCFGTAFGVIYNNIPLGIASGALIGAILDGYYYRKHKKDENDKK